MNNNNADPRGRKISKFVEQDSVLSSDFFTFVRNGQNFKVPFQSLINAVGGIGQLKPAGAPTSTAILQQPSSTFSLIRGIEASQGITATVSPQNGISLKTNFANTGNGQGLLVDPTAAQILVRSLNDGDGIVINEEDDGSITISTTTSTVTTKTVLVTDVDDFPAPVSGVITLDDNTDYFLQNDITTANRFEIGASTSLRGPASQIITLAYTGAGVMFTGTNPNFRIDRITMDCPNGTLMDVSSPGTGIFQIIESTIQSCQDIGTIGDMFLVRFKGIAIENIINDGVKFSGVGVIGVLVFDTLVTFNNSSGATFIDFQNQLFSAVTITNIVNNSSQPATWLSGLANSGNIIAGGLGYVNNVRTPSNVTPLNGISSDDARYNFFGNDAIADTRPDALISLNNNATATVVAGTGIPIKAAGTWTLGEAAQFTIDTTGRATYIGEKPARLPIDINPSMERTGGGGGGEEFSAYVAVNGAVIAESGVQVTLEGGDLNQAVTKWQYNFQPGDYVELWVERNSGGNDVVVVDSVLRVN